MSRCSRLAFHHNQQGHWHLQGREYVSLRVKNRLRIQLTLPIRPCCVEHATMVGQLVSATIVDKLQWYWVIPFFDASNDCLQFISAFCQYPQAITLNLRAHLRMA